MRKKTQEEWLDMARAKHGDYYDYSLANYQGMDKKVLIICPIHGVFEQNAHAHVSKSGCPKCGHKSHTTEEMLIKFREVHGDKDQYPNYKYEPNHKPFKIITPEYGEVWMDADKYLRWKRNSPRKHYTENELIEKAKLCDSIVDFQKKYPNECNFAYRHGDIEKCHEVFMPYTKKTHEENDYLIYAYEDLENKVVYVGLTYQLHIRHCSHKRKKNGKFDTVGEYFHSIGKELPEPIVKISNLSQKEAKWAEGWYRDFYTQEGWQTLNKAKTGIYSSSVGGTFETITYDTCYETALKCKSQEEMKQISSAMVNKARKKGWLKDYTWFTYRDHRSRRKQIAQYTKDGTLVKKWDDVFEIVKNLKETDNKYKYRESNIRQVCIGDKKSAYGFIWKYVQ